MLIHYKVLLNMKGSLRQTKGRASVLIMNACDGLEYIARSRSRFRLDIKVNKSAKLICRRVVFFYLYSIDDTKFQG